MFSYCERMTVPVQVFCVWKNETIELQWLLSNAMRSLVARCSATVVIE